MTYNLPIQSSTDLIAVTVDTLIAQGVCGGRVNVVFGAKPQTQDLPLCTVYIESEQRTKKSAINFDVVSTLVVTCAEESKPAEKEDTTIGELADQTARALAFLATVNATYEAMQDALFADPVWNSPGITGFDPGRSGNIIGECGIVKHEEKSSAYIGRSTIRIPVKYTASYSMRTPSDAVPITEISHSLETTQGETLVSLITLPEPPQT